MLKSFFEKVDYFCFFLFVTVFICFGFFFTNPVMGIDDELTGFFTSSDVILQVGRLGKFITNILFQPQFIPLVYDVLGIFFFVLAIVLICDLLKKHLPEISKKELTIFSTVAISFPFAACVFTFVHNCIDLGLCFLSSTVATCFFFKYFYEEKKNINLLYSFMLLIFSLSLYETGLFYFILSFLFFVFYLLVFNKNLKHSNSDFCKQLFACLFLVGLTIVIYRIVLKIVMYCCGMTYNKIDDYLNYDFSSLGAFLTSVKLSYGEFFHFFNCNVNQFFSCKLIVFSCVVLSAIALYFSIRRKNILVFLVALLMILVPVSYFIGTGFQYMQYRIFFSYGLVVAFAFVVLYKLFAKNVLVSNIFIFICFLVVFQQAKEMNAMFYTEHLKYENDKLFANSIDYDLKRLGYDKYPVIFVGVRKKLDLPYSFEGIANEINASTFNWDRAFSKEEELTSKRPYKFIQKLGYDIYPYLSVSQSDEFVTKEEKTEILQQYEDKLKSIVPTLEIYPRENSIKKVDDFVLVKIGHSYFDNNVKNYNVK